MCDCVFPDVRVKFPQEIKPHYREYSRWCAMLSRCYDVKRKDYLHYGGRGIRVSKEWMEDFNLYLKDLGPSAEGMTIDRIENDLHYCKHNIKFSTRHEQNINRRPLTKKSELPKYIYKVGNTYQSQIRIHGIIYPIYCSTDLELVLEKLKEFCLEWFGKYPT